MRGGLPGFVYVNRIPVDEKFLKRESFSLILEYIIYLFFAISIGPKFYFWLYRQKKKIGLKFYF